MSEGIFGISWVTVKTTTLVAASSISIMKQFFESVPLSLEETACTDGANPLQTFSRPAGLGV